jgi:hypothetical protein
MSTKQVVDTSTRRNTAKMPANEPASLPRAIILHGPEDDDDSDYDTDGPLPQRAVRKPLTLDAEDEADVTVDDTPAIKQIDHDEPPINEHRTLMLRGTSDGDDEISDDDDEDSEDYLASRADDRDSSDEADDGAPVRVNSNKFTRRVSIADTHL